VSPVYAIHNDTRVRERRKPLMQIKPLADRVVVKPLEETEQMKGGLYIPDTAKEKPQQGEVVAVGPGRVSDEGTRIEVELKTGDRVIYGKYSGTEVTVDEEEYLILRESDVLAIVSNGKK
jgi:chaperonin GroES